MLYFLIINYNSSELIQRLINSLGSNKLKIQIIIINNSLEDQAILKLKAVNIKIITAPENLGFGRACNLGLNWIFRRNRQAIVWLINPDAYFETTLLNSDNSPQNLAIAFSRTIQKSQSWVQLSPIAKVK